MSKRKAYIKSCEISEMKTFTLNGFSQKVVFEGKLKTNPIIIYLHGGPGSPLPFCAGSRGLFPEITDNYTMVYWDQLGCGINDYDIDESFSINTYVSMTVDLIKSVKNLYPNTSINLFGVSWGSILVARALTEISDSIDKVVVYGQVVKNLFFNNDVFCTLEHAKMKNKEFKQLRAIKIKPSHSKQDILNIGKLLNAYTEGYFAKKGGKTPIGKIIWGLLTSPDYTFKDFKATVQGGAIKNQSLYEELCSIDITTTLSDVKIPYLMLQGSTDIITSAKNIQSVINTSKNKNLMLQIIEDSGHFPSAKGMDAVINKGFSFFNQ